VFSTWPKSIVQIKGGLQYKLLYYFYIILHVMLNIVFIYIYDRRSVNSSESRFATFPIAVAFVLCTEYTHSYYTFTCCLHHIFMLHNFLSHTTSCIWVSRISKILYILASHGVICLYSRLHKTCLLLEYNAPWEKKDLKMLTLYYLIQLLYILRYIILVRNLNLSKVIYAVTIIILWNNIVCYMFSAN